MLRRGSYLCGHVLHEGGSRHARCGSHLHVSVLSLRGGSQDALRGSHLCDARMLDQCPPLQLILFLLFFSLFLPFLLYFKLDSAVPDLSLQAHPHSTRRP